MSTGSFGSENPGEGVRIFAVTINGQTPSLPWNTTNMATVPDDGTFYVDVGMGLLDIAATVSGSASTWVEFEAWFTAVYST